MDRQQVISTVQWASIGLVILLAINLVIILIAGHRHPVVILSLLSTLAFFESGIFLVIGGCILMIGGFPSLSKALRNETNPEKLKETRMTSYSPLLLAGFLILVSIIASLFVY